MTMIDRDKFINDMTMLYQQMGFHPLEKHFSLQDLVLNLESPEYEVNPQPMYVEPINKCKTCEYSKPDAPEWLYCNVWNRLTEPSGYCYLWVEKGKRNEQKTDLP